MNVFYRLVKLSRCRISAQPLFKAPTNRNYGTDREITVTEPSQRQDILFQNMKSATDVSDVLNLVKTHSVIMNNRHLMQAFRTIFMLQKSDHSHMSNKEVINSNGFRVLCQTLKSQSRSLEVGDVLDALKTLSFLGVPATSKLVQILLHLITKEINGLSLQQILFFDFLVKDFEVCPIVDALKIALPIVLEANIQLKIEPDNVPLLAELLCFATRRNLSETTVNLLVDNLMKSRKQIDFRSAKSIVRSICDLKNPNESCRPLLHYCLDDIMENHMLCTYSDFDSLTSKLAFKYSPKHFHFFYHEEFMNSASQFVLTHNCSLEEAVWLLRKNLKFGHEDLDLLNFIAVKGEEEPHYLEGCGSMILFSIVNGFAVADYRPDCWPILENLILKNAISRLEQVELPWLKFVRDLCSLDCWSPDLFRAVFDKNFLTKYLSREYNMLDHLQLLSVYHAVSTFCPWYQGPWPPEEMLKAAIEMNGANISGFPLLPYLEKGLGATKCVQSGVRTKSGHFIDHVILMRKGGFPVTLPQLPGGNRKIYFEDLPDLEDCQKLAVLLVPGSAYTINTGKLRGYIRMNHSCLEMCGVSVVPISSVIWDQLLEHEKVNYLMKEIQTKLSDSLINKLNN